MSSEIIQLTCLRSFTLLLPLPFPTVSQLHEDDNITSQDFPGSQEQSPMFILQQHLPYNSLDKQGALAWGAALKLGTAASLTPSSSDSVDVQKQS